MNLALVYDRVNKIGGAERVLMALHELYPHAPLYTAVYNPQTAPWAKDFQVISSPLNHIPYLNNHHEYIPFLMPYAFESFDLSAFDVIISITSAEAKGVITKPNQLHLCYLLTPTRYLYSHRAEYQGSGLSSILRQPILNSLSQWDHVAASRPDQYIAISQHVANRCERYYHRTPSAIIYPPVDTDRFTKPTFRTPHNVTHNPKPTTNYFLIVSRLVPYKKIDLAIKACNQLQENLVIIGTGSEEKKLKKIAGPTITFLGQVDDTTLSQYYHQAQAFIFPQEEEFGIAAVEAMSAGLPVIAYQGGSATEIIRPHVTGVLFPHQTINDLVEAIISWKTKTWYGKTIQEHAQNFSKKLFQTQFKAHLEALWTQHQSA